MAGELRFNAAMWPLSIESGRAEATVWRSQYGRHTAAFALRFTAFRPRHGGQANFRCAHRPPFAFSALDAVLYRAL